MITATKATHADEGIAETLSAKGLNAAARFLDRQGYEILERSWECRFGGADLIALGEDALIFIEVETRLNEDRGMAENAVTEAKRSMWEKIAIEYLAAHTFYDTAVRFDVISILVVSTDRAFLRHRQNAFSVG